ncbi:hypothetical protein MGH68_06350 [Erysipelothrix sp. D19-032]
MDKSVTKKNVTIFVIVKAFVPLSEMSGYTTDLRSFTQGRGNSSMQFDHYEVVPKSIR